MVSTHSVTELHGSPSLSISILKQTSTPSILLHVGSERLISTTSRSPSRLRALDRDDCPNSPKDHGYLGLQEGQALQSRPTPDERQCPMGRLQPGVAAMGSQLILPPGRTRMDTMLSDAALFWHTGCKQALHQPLPRLHHSPVISMSNYLF